MEAELVAERERASREAERARGAIRAKELELASLEEQRKSEVCGVSGQRLRVRAVSGGQVSGGLGAAGRGRLCMCVHVHVHVCVCVCMCYVCACVMCVEKGRKERCPLLPRARAMLMYDVHINLLNAFESS